MGIDLGSKHYGIAFIDDQNRVLAAGQCRIEGDLAKIIENRRMLRQARRSHTWYRRPKIPIRGGESAKGGKKPLLYKRAQGLNKPKTLCAYVDPNTGLVCGCHTPKRSKLEVRRVLLEQFCKNNKIPKPERGDLLALLNPNAQHARKLEDLLSLLKMELKLKESLLNQVRSLVCGRLEGRARFCRKHLQEYLKIATLPTMVAGQEDAWLPPSVLYRNALIEQDFKRYIEALRVPCGSQLEIRIERAQFDLQKLRNPAISGEEYQAGWRKDQNLIAALMTIYGDDPKLRGRMCCYCDAPNNAKGGLEVEHIHGRKRGSVLENLVLAHAECNLIKLNRTPEEAGLTLRYKPKTNILEKWSSHFTRASMGVHDLQRRLQRVCEQHGIQWRFSYRYGYETFELRQKWQLPKDHYIDAIVVASDSQPQGDIPDPHLRVVSLQANSKQLFDVNPVARLKDGRFAQSTLVTNLKVGEIERVLDPRKRKLLVRVAQEKGLMDNTGRPVDAKAENKSFTADDLKRLPFKKVRVIKEDVSASNAREIRGHWYKAVTPNYGYLVYEDHNGQRKSQLLKNPLAFPHHHLSLSDSARKLFVLKRGMRIQFTRQGSLYEECITKIYSNGYIAVKVRTPGQKPKEIRLRPHDPSIRVL